MKLLSLNIQDVPWPKQNAKMPLMVVCPHCKQSFSLAMGFARNASVICSCGCHIEIKRDEHNAIEVVDRDSIK